MPYDEGYRATSRMLFVQPENEADALCRYLWSQRIPAETMMTGYGMKRVYVRPKDETWARVVLRDS